MLNHGWNYTKFDVTGNHKQFWKPCMNDFVCTQHGSGKTIKKERNDTVWNLVSSDAFVLVGFLQLVLTLVLGCLLFTYLWFILNAVSSSNYMVSNGEKTST